MRVKTFYRFLRIVSAVVLFFFVWSFGPVWQAVAFAATSRKTDARQKTDTGRPDRVNAQKPEERFEKALEDIREKVGRVGEKADRGEDDTAERAAIRAKKSEVDSLADELRKGFIETERKLKAAGLPKTILTRHADFVAHFEKNLKALRDNLEGIETAKTSIDRKAKIEQARLHLEKTRPARRHTPLNPDQLPNRNRKATKTVEPRLKKEDFERDFPKQHKAGKMAGLQAIFAANEHEWARTKNKPVQLAFNGPDSDIPFFLDAQTIKPQIAFADTAPFLLAQAASQPTADDLAETPEVQFTDAIRAKAQELGNNPVKIYEYVRNNIEYAPTYGSIQGADMCLQSKICNDTDTASLLISLLRVSGIYAHYVYGTVDVPIEKAMNWVGGVTDPKMVGTIFATNGVPVTLLKTSASVYKYVRIEHVWVSAFIDYIPSRGAVQRQGNTWIPLDPSYKTYNYVQGIDISSAVPFDAQSFANQILATATTNTTDGSVTNVNSALIQQTLQDYQTQVQNYIQQNYPNATVGAVIGKKEIIKQEFGILPETLPYKGALLGSEFAQIPDNLREAMSFSIPDPTGASAGLTYTTGMPQIAGKKITLSFSPATANDQAVIESLLPAPHADGTPIQPSELPSSFHAYLINLKPELRIDGQVVATGASTMMGIEQSFTISLNEPGIGLSNIDNIIKAGEYFGIGVDVGRIGYTRIDALKRKLELTKSQLTARYYADITKEDIVGDFLCATITSYFAQLDMDDEIGAAMQGVIRYRVPSVGMFSVVLNTNEVFGVPISAGSSAMMMDIDRIVQAVFSADGSMDTVKKYMLASGIKSSALENAVPEQLYSQPGNPIIGISAVKALQIANDQGIPIYTINQENMSTIMPQLQIATEAKNDIANAVNAGKVVEVSKSNISLSGWSGCGYIVTDPITGAGAYMISGGANGCYIAMFVALIFLIAALAALAFLGGIAAIILAALFIFIGIMAVYAEMYFAFGKDKANEFLGCLSIIAIVHLVVKRLLKFLPVDAEPVVKNIEFLMGLHGTYELTECFADLSKQ